MLFELNHIDAYCTAGRRLFHLYLCLKLSMLRSLLFSATYLSAAQLAKPKPLVVSVWSSPVLDHMVYASLSVLAVPLVFEAERKTRITTNTPNPMTNHLKRIDMDIDHRHSRPAQSPKETITCQSKRHHSQPILTHGKIIHTASRSIPPKGKPDTPHTYRHRHPSMDTDIHTCKHTSRHTWEKCVISTLPARQQLALAEQLVLLEPGGNVNRAQA